MKFVRGQSEPFSFSEKKDPGRNPDLPHKPGEARNFFASPKKGFGFGKISTQDFFWWLHPPF